jgi:hypothetical protein
MDVPIILHEGVQYTPVKRSGDIVWFGRKEVARQEGIETKRDLGLISVSVHAIDFQSHSFNQFFKLSKLF